MNTEKVYIVIPVYNESTKITHVIDDLHAKGYKNIVLVDDGSKDDTYDVLKRTKYVFVLHHIVNRGQGAALKTGTDFAVMQGAEYVVHFDSDGQHSSKEIPDMIKPLVEEGFDICVGSRFIGEKQESNVPLSKKIVLRFGIFVTWFLSGIFLSDTHNGFRAMTAEAASKISISLDRFEHASEILDQIKVKKLKYKEVPVTITYSDYSRAKGQKISNSIKIALHMVWYKLDLILFKNI